MAVWYRELCIIVVVNLPFSSPITRQLRLRQQAERTRPFFEAPLPHGTNSAEHFLFPFVCIRAVIKSQPLQQVTHPARILTTMKRSYYMTLALAAVTVSETLGFAPPFVGVSAVRTHLKAASVTGPEIPSPAELEDRPQDVLSEISEFPQPKKAPKQTPQKHNTGVLSPVVLLAKDVLGDDRLNKIRAKAISLHSDVIASFVELADTPVGSAFLKTLFNAADVNHNGKIEEEELAKALKTLGFDWLKEKQVHGIFERADLDHNGMLDLEEWMREAPKTLRTNLIKLAKKNGGELGLLA